jgi:hypothetical protein
MRGTEARNKINRGKLIKHKKAPRHQAFESVDVLNFVQAAISVEFTISDPLGLWLFLK